MGADEVDTEELLGRAAVGDRSAVGSLLERNQGRLRKLVARRLDPRIATRVDPSDVVQEVMSLAMEGIPRFARERPVPFAYWLRRQAIVRLGWLHRFHLRTGKRSVAREVPYDDGGRSEGGAVLNGLEDSGTGPSTAADRAERSEMVRAALGRLEPPDREILDLRYVFRLSQSEICERLAISPSAVKMRHARALERFRISFRGGDA